jgi:zona occludens toxin
VIAAVTGAPGSGKSYYCTRKIADSLDRGKMVATNVTLVDGWEQRLACRNRLRLAMPGRVDSKAAEYARNSYYTDSLGELMRVRLSGEGESRGVAVIDEAHEWLNNRTWDDEDRKDFVRWFSLHRKLGWDTYLITQHIDSIDKQIRDRIEFHIVLRNVRNMKFAGIPVMPCNAFLAIWVWLGGPRTKRHIAKRELFFLDGRRKLYDTMGLQGLDQDIDNAIWLPRVSLVEASGGASAGATRAQHGVPGAAATGPLIEVELEPASAPVQDRA